MSTTTISLSEVNEDINLLPNTPNVYMIINHKNGRCYVGSSKALSTRIRYTLSCLKRHVKLPKEFLEDYEKFGINTFTISFWPVMKEFLSSVEKVVIDLNIENDVYNIYYTGKKRLSVRNSKAWERISEIRYLRYEKGYTLKEIASTIGASYSTVRRILLETDVGH